MAFFYQLRKRVLELVKRDKIRLNRHNDLKNHDALIVPKNWRNLQNLGDYY